jgi:hypothetical protein
MQAHKFIHVDQCLVILFGIGDEMEILTVQLSSYRQCTQFSPSAQPLTAFPAILVRLINFIRVTDPLQHSLLDSHRNSGTRFHVIPAPIPNAHVCIASEVQTRT